MKHVDLQDFRDLFDNRTLPEMQTSVYQCIAQFFTVYKQGENYVIDGNREALENYFYGCLDIYAKFGIYPEYAVPGLMAVPHVICYVGDDTDLDSKIASFETEFGNIPMYIVNMSDNVEVNKLIKIALPECMIMNKSAMGMEEKDKAVTVKSSNHRNYEIYEYVDITEDIRAVCKNYISINFCIREYKKLLDSIRHKKHNSRTIFCLGFDADQQMKYLFTCVASILTFEGFNFEVPNDMTVVYISNLVKAQDRSYMMLSDYLDKLANPVSLGVGLYGARAYICILNHKPGESIYRSKNFNLDLVTAELDDSLALVGNELERITVQYSDIEVLDFVEGYKLLNAGQENFSEILENHKRLTSILTEFEEEIMQLVPLSNTVTLNFSNTLLYRLNGKTYLGFAAKLPDLYYDYTFIPVCPKYRQFKSRLNVIEYDRIYDVNIFTEKDVLLKQFDKYCFADHRHFKKPRFLDGMIMTTITITKETIEPDAGLSFPEVGIWSSQSSKGRTMALQFLLTRFNRIELHNKRFLSFWGGCHPMDLTHLSTDYKIWKGGNTDE